MPRAPDDFPDALPDRPPTVDGIREILDSWENVEHVNDLRWEEEDRGKVCEYMIFNTDDRRGFRVIWEDDDWFVRERSSTY
jgi:hypothetical protein